MATLLVVGGGRMGSALVRGLLGAGWHPGDVVIAESDARRRDQLVAAFPRVSVRAAPEEAGGAVLSVKPADAAEATRALAATGTPRVLSIMAGVTLARLESWLDRSTAVVRAMPNTPATVGAGVSAMSGGSRADEDVLAWAEGLLGSVGQVLRVPEVALDAVTGLSGSGPAYVFFVVEALTAGGVAAGLSDEVSRTLATCTVAGAARLLTESGVAPEQLRAQVTSPGGTTEAGIRVLEDREVRSALVDAVAAAAERARELDG